MKHMSIFVSYLLASPTSAHYVFGRLIFENRWSKTWEYVREVSPEKTMTPPTDLVAPIYKPDSVDMRCGCNATLGWSKPKTATIRAGDTVGFGVGEPQLGTGVPTIYHPGFASAWLSKSPTEDLNAYQADGDWFKIMSVTGRNEQSPELKPGYDRYKAIWGVWQADSWNFTIPESTPPGKYLLRFEQIFPNKVEAQFFMNCAHVEIVNPSNNIGSPGPLAKLPGVYTNGQPDVYFDKYAEDFDIAKFVAPKPEVWRG